MISTTETDEKQMTSALDVMVFNTVDAIGKEAIDSIAVDGFFTYGWFKTLESSNPIPINPFYVTVHKKGKLMALAPCFIDEADQYFHFGPYVIPFMKTFLDTSKKLRLTQNHVLLCYSPYCYRTKISLRKNLNEDTIFDDLTNKIDAVCKKQKILFSSFQFVSEFDNHLSTRLKSNGYRKFFWRNSLYLNVSWRNFDDYLQSLKHGIRNRIRREMKSCKENGVTIEKVSEFKNLSATLSDLFSNLILKYHKNSKGAFKPLFYERLSDFANDKAVVFIAKKNGAVIGFSVCMRHRDILDVFHCGFDYELMDKSDFVYFNICYYEPIRWAIEEGIKKMYYRLTAEDVKYRRGCKPERVYTYVKCHNKFLNAQIGNYLKLRDKLIKAPS